MDIEEKYRIELVYGLFVIMIIIIVMLYAINYY